MVYSFENLKYIKFKLLFLIIFIVLSVFSLLMVHSLQKITLKHYAFTTFSMTVSILNNILFYQLHNFRRL